MSRTNVLQNSDGILCQIVIIALVTDETRSRCLGKGHTEFDVGRCPGEDFIQVFGRFDEMRLAQDDVGAFGNLNPNRFEFHICLAC